MAREETTTTRKGRWRVRVTWGGCCLVLGSCGATFAQTVAVDTVLRAGTAALQRHDLKMAHADFRRAVELGPHRAEAYAGLGATLLAEGNARAATSELKHALALRPENKPAQLNLALAFAAISDYPDAVATYDVWRAKGELPEFDGSASLTLATALSATGRAAEAQALLTSAVAANSGDAGLHDALGVVEAQQGELGSAAAEFTHAAELNPRAAAPHFHLGSVALAQHTPEGAVRELAEAHRLAPENVQYATQLGVAQGQAGKDAAALVTLRDAVQRAGDSTAADAIEARYQLALAMQNGGDSESALAYFQQTVKARPRDAGALINLALAMVQTGDARGAIPLYLRAEIEDPANPTLREDLGVAYLQQSDLDNAVAQFRKGLAADGGNTHLHYDLGLALKLKDKLDEAVPEFLEAERLDPHLPDPPYTLGVIYMQQGKQAEAQTALERAVTLRPENGEAWSLLGNVLKDAGEMEASEVALRKAIVLLPAQPSPHITLAALLSGRGDRAGALAERKIAATLSKTAMSRQQADFALNSGRALMEQGKLEQAVVQLRTAVAAEPQRRAPHAALATALERTHQPAEAAQERALAASLSDTP